MDALLRAGDLAGGARPAAAPVRPRPAGARPRRAGPRHRRVGRREHLRRRRRAAVLGRAARRAGAARLPRGQHARRDGRPPLARATRGFGWAAARADDVANLLPARLTAALDRRARAGGRRPAAGGAAGLAARRRASTPRRTPARSRPRSPARSAAPSAAGSPTPAGSRTGRCSATGPRPAVDDVAPRRPAVARGAGGRGRARRRRAGAAGPPPVKGALLVAGTTSRRRQERAHRRAVPLAGAPGRAVAPFKAQNMSLNSAVTADGAEIGRAQAVQAAAAGIEPEAAMNPVLLKPGSDQHLAGRAARQAVRRRVGACRYRQHKAALLEVSLDCLADLRSPLRRRRLRGRGQPGRDQPAGHRHRQHGPRPGGRGCRCWWSATSTPAASSPPCSARSRCCRRRTRRWSPGSSSTSSAATCALLEPGLEMLRGLTGRPTYGVLPWTEGLELDVEDSLGLSAPGRAGARASAATCCGCRWCGCRGCRTGPTSTRCAPSRACWSASRRRRRSSPTPTSSCCRAAARPCRTSPGCAAAGSPTSLAAPGRRGPAGARHLRRLPDARPHDHRRRRVAGGHRRRARAAARAAPSSAREKVLARPVGTYGRAPGDHRVRDPPRRDHPRRRRAAVRPRRGLPRRVRCSARSGTARSRATACGGPCWPRSRRRAGRDWTPGTRAFEDVRQARLDALGDLVADHLDTDAVVRLLEHGAPAGLPFVPPGRAAAPHLLQQRPGLRDGRDAARPARPP